MKMHSLARIVLLLAALLLAASLLSWGLMQSIREPEVYDPRGGPLAVDGLWIGMTYDEVVQVTGQRPAGFLSNILVEHVIPGDRLETGVGFRRSEGGALEDATVSDIEGSVLTQDGRILLDFHSLSRWNSPKTSDITGALGRPNSWDGNYYYRLEGVDLTIIDPGRYPGMAGRFRLISLNLPIPPAPPPSAQSTHPDPEGRPKQ